MFLDFLTIFYSDHVRNKSTDPIYNDFLEYPIQILTSVEKKSGQILKVLFYNSDQDHSSGYLMVTFKHTLKISVDGCNYEYSKNYPTNFKNTQTWTIAKTFNGVKFYLDGLLMIDYVASTVCSEDDWSVDPEVMVFANEDTASVKYRVKPSGKGITIHILKLCYSSN